MQLKNEVTAAFSKVVAEIFKFYQSRFSVHRIESLIDIKLNYHQDIICNVNLFLLENYFVPLLTSSRDLDLKLLLKDDQHWPSKKQLPANDQCELLISEFLERHSKKINFLEFAELLGVYTPPSSVASTNKRSYFFVNDRDPEANHSRKVLPRVNANITAPAIRVVYNYYVQNENAAEFVPAREVFQKANLKQFCVSKKETTRMNFMSNINKFLKKKGYIKRDEMAPRLFKPTGKILPDIKVLEEELQVFNKMMKESRRVGIAANEESFPKKAFKL